AFVAEMQQKHGIAPLYLQCDITDVAALQDAIREAAEAHGPISMLVNNAANDARHSLQDYSVEDWDRGMAVNLRPHFFTAQAVAPGMKQLGGGAIINFSSISYMMGSAGYPGYATSKSAITGLTRSLARELGPDGIRVNSLMPGWVLTQKQLDQWATPEDLETHLGRQCLKEHLAPRDIVDATLFLASQASRMMTGQAMVVDGGVVVTG
ncbi:SDR family NAD(P)-dependent oxidoreductase, partial [Marinobacter alexandrii]